MPKYCKPPIFIPCGQLIIFGRIPMRERREAILKWLNEVYGITGSEAYSMASDIMSIIREYGFHRGVT